ncbi:amino acid permease [Paenibacillus soyae]|uniref:Amino acid permease n=1 Tax=Paenibacillus soyae TaxID=2969249 RepID=A0A9X2S720_9BACL|nr:amino acid permease [Paenibacillus soyae]MCR2802849.1 amino acid permease [Paenibacillus soyae]
MLTILLGLILFGAVCALIMAIAFKAQRGLRLTGYQSMARYGKQTQMMQDKHDLGRFGLAQLLRRSGGGIWPLGLSSGSMALIGSSVILFGPALQQGGLSVIGYGLPLLGLFYLCVSGSLAELSSAYPVAGSFYHASYEMGGRRWGLRAGWFHAAGHLAMLALLVGGCAYLADGAASAFLGYDSSIFSFGAMILAVAGTLAAVHQYGAAWLKVIHAAGLWFQLLCAVLIIAGLTWMFWPGGYSPALLYEMQTIDFSGKVGLEPFLVALLLLAKLFLGMDGASQGAEETIEPRVRVPWAIFLSTSYTFVIGLVLLTFLALTAGSIQAAGGGFEPSLGWNNGLAGLNGFMESALTGFGGSPLVLLLIIGTLWGSGLQSLSVCARALLGLAREEAVPFAGKVGWISGRTQTPWLAGWISAAVAVMMLAGAQLLRPEASLLPLLGFSIVTLHAAYAIPIGLRFTHWKPAGTARKRRPWAGTSVESRWSSAPWQLGGWSPAVNGAAFLWLVATAAAAAVFLDHAAAVGGAAIVLLVTVFELGDGRRARRASGK